MYIPLIFLPLAGFCITGLFGRAVGPKGSAIITTSCLVISFFLSLFAFYEVGFMGSPVYIRLSTWVSSEVLLINWGFLFDSLTVVMCIVVTFVSSLVHLYSIEYMAHDRDCGRCARGTPPVLGRHCGHSSSVVNEKLRTTPPQIGSSRTTSHAKPSSCRRRWGSEKHWPTSLSTSTPAKIFPSRGRPDEHPRPGPSRMVPRKGAPQRCPQLVLGRERASRRSQGESSCEGQSKGRGGCSQLEAIAEAGHHLGLAHGFFMQSGRRSATGGACGSVSL